jgi:hypothetical protein
MRNRQAMRNVDISRSSPAADEADGRKAPGPEARKRRSELLHTRVEPELAKAFKIRAEREKLSPSAAAREAITLYARPDTLSRRQRGSVVGELIQLRYDLGRIARLHAMAERKGGSRDEATLRELHLTLQAIAQAAGRIMS